MLKVTRFTTKGPAKKKHTGGENVLLKIVFTDGSWECVEDEKLQVVMDKDEVLIYSKGVVLERYKERYIYEIKRVKEV